FTYFENIGSRKEPKYADGKFLTVDDDLLKVECCMFVPVAFDWDDDGHVDLIVGQEDGRVMFIRNSGKVSNGIPQFETPRYFRQQAEEIKEGVLVTPCGVDWDNDGLEDLICGN